jgi:hypothetical protein
VPLGSFFLMLRFVELLIQALRNKEAVREDVLAEALADALADVPEEEREKFEKMGKEE